MSRDKQIEEIADIIATHTSFDTMWDECTASAIALYNAGYRKIPENIGDFSDGYHTFNELYHHRAVLFSVICNMMPEKAWKSKLHDTGDMFDGMFIVGIETEQGQATYHYDIEPYWDMFKVKELEKAPKWDGHTPSDAIERIGSLSCEGYRKHIGEPADLDITRDGFEYFLNAIGYRKQSEGEWIQDVIAFCNVCSLCKAKVDRYAIVCNSGKLNFCPNCGAKMKGGE